MDFDYKTFFEFLFPEKGPVNFELHAPDILERRWTVFDANIKRTIGFGLDPTVAVSEAIAFDLRRQLSKLPPLS